MNHALIFVRSISLSVSLSSPFSHLYSQTAARTNSRAHISTYRICDVTTNSLISAFFQSSTKKQTNKQNTKTLDIVKRSNLFNGLKNEKTLIIYFCVCIWHSVHLWIICHILLLSFLLLLLSFLLRLLYCICLFVHLAQSYRFARTSLCLCIYFKIRAEFIAHIRRIWQIQPNK